MVLVSNYQIKEKSDGTTFTLLELTGSLELIQSSSTGNFYATVRKCKIPTTFDATVAKKMIGIQMDGEIVRIDCEPYNYVNKQTGEEMTLYHSYAYRPKGAFELIGATQLQDNNELV
jgi:hypothetical protein